MIIESIELKNYRNYENLHLTLDPGTNIFYGDNAQGKTNILESVFLGCTSKSYKMAKDRDMIRFGVEEAHIKLCVRKRDVPFRIDMHLKKAKSKGIAIDGIPIKRASELFGIANVVCFSPEDLSLVKEGPALRRRFMDLELCQLDKVYVHHLISYNKLVNQRNRLLKDLSYRPEYMDTLDAWDEQLILHGEKLISIRGNFITELNKIIHEIHYRLSGGREDLRILYEPSAEAGSYEEALGKSREADIRHRLTMVGPHRDDINFLIDGIDIRKFGSQGQQRTAALALKLSEIELVRRQIQDDPILLLDDVLSELDANRQNYLLELLKQTQTIITCTGLDDFVNNRFQIDRVFRVVDGKIDP